MLGQRSEAEQLRQEMESLKPRILFQDELNRIDASFAIMDGDFEEAEQYAMAISFRESGYLLMQFLQLITVARFRGEAEQMLPLIESVSADYTDLPAVKVYLALLYADVGQFSASEEELGKLKPDLSGLNQDISWHAMLVALTEVAVLTKNLDLAQTLLERLPPFSGTQLVFTTICVFGFADLYIGLLKNLLGHADADKYFHLALEQNQKAGHLPMIARSKLLVSEITTS